MPASNSRLTVTESKGQGERTGSMEQRSEDGWQTSCMRELFGIGLRWDSLVLESSRMLFLSTVCIMFIHLKNVTMKRHIDRVFIRDVPNVRIVLYCFVIGDFNNQVSGIKYFCTNQMCQFYAKLRDGKINERSTKRGMQYQFHANVQKHRVEQLTDRGHSGGKAI